MIRAICTYSAARRWSSLVLMWHLVQSPFGYTLRMIRDNPRRATFLGIPVWRVRLLAFIVAGVFGGVGGILIAFSYRAPIPILRTGRCRAKRCS